MKGIIAKRAVDWVNCGSKNFPLIQKSVVLHTIALYCMFLDNIVLHGIMLQSIVSQNIVLCTIVLHYIMLDSLILQMSA